MTSTARDLVHLDWLIHLFHPDRTPLGEFTRASEDELPTYYRLLLAHQHHMTVTLESHHDSLVDVHLIGSRQFDPFYLREIYLQTQKQGDVVMYGIVRLFLPVLRPEVREEIFAGKTPLGRILIKRGVLREVRLGELWRIACGPKLAELFSVEPRTETYGRTALIYFDRQPALELLEIVAPEPAPLSDDLRPGVSPNGDPVQPH